MRIANPARGWTATRVPSPVVLVTQVGAATGSRAAAAALACAASETDRAALLVDFGGSATMRPSLIATAGARALEERLAGHLPDARIASRGRFCQLNAAADPAGIDRIAAALPLARESAAVIHLPPALMRPLLEETRIRSTSALLRADLSADRALTALAARDLIERGLRVTVLKRSLGWFVTRAALLGALPNGLPALPPRLWERLMSFDDKTLRQCYAGKDEAKDGRHEVWRKAHAKPARAQWNEQRQREWRDRA
jgi:hypothetical protein